MTLIAGIKCKDGFLIAADTAVSARGITYHGEKLQWYMSPTGMSYALAIACAGDLTYARMTAQMIRDQTAIMLSPTIAMVRDQIVKVLIEVHSAHISQFWALSDPDAPSFSLIIGIEIEGKFELFITDKTAIEEIGPYVFQGSGHHMAMYLAESLLRQPSGALQLPAPISASIHLIMEIFRVVKQYVPDVGLDTQIIAYRTLDSDSKFSTPAAQLSGTQSLIGVIQDNLRQALWRAYYKSDTPDALLEGPLQTILNLVRKIKDEIKELHETKVRYVRYSLKPATGEWSMEDLRPPERVFAELRASTEA